MSDDLVTWFEEANGFVQGTKAPHKWVLQAEQELRFQARRIKELEAKLSESEALLAKAVEIGNRMAASIEGNYYIPGVAGEWRKLTGGKDE